MKLIINGKETSYEGVPKLGALFDHLKIKASSVAVAVDAEVVEPQNVASFELSAGDRIELFAFAGGG